MAYVLSPAKSNFSNDSLSKSVPFVVQKVLNTKISLASEANPRQDFSTSFKVFRASWESLEKITIFEAQCLRLAERSAGLLLSVKKRFETSLSTGTPPPSPPPSPLSVGSGDLLPQPKTNKDPTHVFRLQSVLFDIQMFMSSLENEKDRQTLLVINLGKTQQSIVDLRGKLVSAVEFYQIDPTTINPEPWPTEDSEDLSADLLVLPRLFKLSISLRGPTFEAFQSSLSAPLPSNISPSKKRELFVEWCLEKQPCLKAGSEDGIKMPEKKDNAGRLGLGVKGTIGPRRNSEMVNPPSARKPIGGSTFVSPSTQGDSAKSLASSSQQALGKRSFSTGTPGVEDIISTMTESDLKKVLEEDEDEKHRKGVFADAARVGREGKKVGNKEEKELPKEKNVIFEQSVTPPITPVSPAPVIKVLDQEMKRNVSGQSEVEEVKKVEKVEEQRVEKVAAAAETAELAIKTDEEIEKPVEEEVKVSSPVSIPDPAPVVVSSPEPIANETGPSPSKKVSSLPHPPPPELEQPAVSVETPAPKLVPEPTPETPVAKPTSSPAAPQDLSFIRNSFQNPVLSPTIVSPASMQPQVSQMSAVSNGTVGNGTVAIAANPLRILCLDGGGTRGILSLLILREVMERIKYQSGLPFIPKPSDYFDLISGSGTGGLIAILLGRLQMDISTAIETYLDMSKGVFGKEKGSIGRFLGKTRFSARELERRVQEEVSRREGDARKGMRDEDAEYNSTRHRRSQSFMGVGTVASERMVHSLSNGSSGGNTERCKTFILAQSSGTLKPRPIRTYDLLSSSSQDEKSLSIPSTGGKDQEGFEEMEIWQAARATNAVSSFFKPLRTESESLGFVDGVSQGEFNNPSEESITEAEKIWGSEREIGAFVTIGTGRLSAQGLEVSGTGRGGKGKVWRTVVGISQGCETVNSRARARFERRYPHGGYWRFNLDADEWLGGEEWEEGCYKAMDGRVRAWARRDEGVEEVSRKLERLKKSGMRISNKRSSGALRSLAHSPSIPQLSSTTVSTPKLHQSSSTPKLESNFRKSSFNIERNFRESLSRDPPKNPDARTSFSGLNNNTFRSDSFISRTQLVEPKFTPSAPTPSTSKALPKISLSSHPSFGVASSNISNQLSSPSLPTTKPGTASNGANANFLGGSSNLSFENLALPDFYLHNFSSTGSFKFTDD